MKSWSDTECEEIITLAGWCRVLSSQCTLKSTWSGSWKGKYAWTFDCLFFFDWRAVSLRWRMRSRNVYQSACRRGIFVCFYLFSTLGVCVWEMVWCGVYILFFVFFLVFVTVSILYITVPLVSFPKILYISRPHRYAWHTCGLLLSM